MGEEHDDRNVPGRGDGARQGGDAATDRRDFLERALVAGGCVWAAGVAVPSAVYLWPARASGPGTDHVDAGSTKDFPVGTERLVQKAGKPILVLRVKEDEFRAFSAVCTHLACVVRWNAQRRQILCPCHAGVFGPDGAVISGPPPRPLAPYRVVVIDETVRVYA
jgi:cytochrome b6-f complex iron-sulfur subunit